MPGAPGKTMRTLSADLRMALRRWAARPVLALTAIATLAVGIGASTSIFSIVDGVLLRPLPWTDPDRLVSIWNVRAYMRNDPALASLWNRGPISWPQFRNLQNHSRTLERVAVWSRMRPVRVSGETGIAEAVQVSSSFLPALGIEPRLGRHFTAAEDETASESAILTYEAWQRRYGGDPDILGRRVEIEDVPRTIVGVLPPRFTFEGIPPEFFLPLGTVPARNRAADNNFLRAIARLRPGVTIEQASTDIEPVLRGVEPRGPRTARLESLAESVFSGQPREALLVLLAGSGLLLLIACANVAGLLLGDARTRRDEVALRRALGAGRARIVRQMVTESLLLAAAGAVAGLVAAWWITPALVAAAPPRLPRIDQVSVDARVLAFGALASVVTVLLFGMAPALAASSVKTTKGATWVRGAMQRVLVAGEVAVAVVLLVGAALLVETVARLRAVPVGFDPARIAVVRLRGPVAALPDMTARQRALLERIRSLPGVAAAGATTGAPFGGSSSSSPVETDARPGERFTAQRFFVTDGYFDAMGQPVDGRTFSAIDAAGQSVIVSQSLARSAFGGQAVGRRIRFNEQWLTVIGVVPDIRVREYTEPQTPAVYQYASQGNAFEIVVRAEGDPQTILTSLQRAVTDLDNRLAFATLETMDTLMAATIAGQRYRATLSSFFGIAAVLLTCIGVYALLSQVVVERRREIGVRVAVGAKPADVITLVLREGGWLLLAGLLVGIPAAVGAARMFASLLYGVEPTAPRIVMAAGLLLTAVTLAAMLPPAARAARLDPVTTLRAS
jgi:putative ABC transport system permease protein